MTNKREELIEKAAKAIEKVPYHAWHDVTREGAREIARAALAVFEQSHTPTNDEREALLSVIISAPESGDALHVSEAERVRDAVLAVGFRRPVQGEPTDAQVLAALRAAAVTEQGGENR